MVTNANNKRRQTPGYNKADDIINGRMTKIPPHSLGLIRQEMFEKWFFAGVDSAPGIENYLHVEIETHQYSTSIDYRTIPTMVKSAVDHAIEARGKTKKKPEVR